MVILYIFFNVVLQLKHWHLLSTEEEEETECSMSSEYEEMKDRPSSSRV